MPFAPLYSAALIEQNIGAIHGAESNLTSHYSLLKSVKTTYIHTQLFLRLLQSVASAHPYRTFF
jgi:hypothetical protein